MKTISFKKVSIISVFKIIPLTFRVVDKLALSSFHSFKALTDKKKQILWVLSWAQKTCRSVIGWSSDEISRKPTYMTFCNRQPARVSREMSAKYKWPVKWKVSFKHCVLWFFIRYCLIPGEDSLRGLLLWLWSMLKKEHA